MMGIWNILKFLLLTSSILKVQSLSSSSCVRGSLNNVTEIVWLSGTGHEIWPISGLTISGSHGRGIDATRLDLRVHTTDKFVGRLEKGNDIKIKSFGSATVDDVMFQILSWILNELNCIKKLLLFHSYYEECLAEWFFWFQLFKLCFITYIIISTHYFPSERRLKGSKKNLVRFGSTS